MSAIDFFWVSVPVIGHFLPKALIIIFKFEFRPPSPTARWLRWIVRCIVPASEMDHYRPSRAFPRVTGPVTIIAYTVSFTGYSEGSGSSSYNSLVDGDKLCNIKVERVRGRQWAANFLKKILYNNNERKDRKGGRGKKKSKRTTFYVVSIFKVRARKIIIYRQHMWIK